MTLLHFFSHSGSCGCTNPTQKPNTNAIPLSKFSLTRPFRIRTQQGLEHSWWFDFLFNFCSQSRGLLKLLCRDKTHCFEICKTHVSHKRVQLNVTHVPLAINPSPSTLINWYLLTESLSGRQIREKFNELRPVHSC